MDRGALEALLTVATPRQATYLHAIIKHGNSRKAAESLGVHRSVISRGLLALRKKLIVSGVPPAQKDDRGDKKILVISDTQVKPGVDARYLLAIGRYIIAKKPDVIVMIGDWADMESLSSYDKGKRDYEGRRYKADVAASIRGMEILLSPIVEYNQNPKNKKRQYKPEMHLTLGNHEHRINRTTQVEPMLFETIGLQDLKFESFGWQVHPFLKVVVIDGVAFSHYFCTGLLSKPCSTAQVQLSKMHMSCVSGHQQGRQTASGKRADGKLMTSIICGSCYDYDMDYLGEQGNDHWRGVVMLHGVKDGSFDEVYVPTAYLKKRYTPSEDPIIL